MPRSNESGQRQPDELLRYVALYVRWSWLIGLCVVIGVVGTYLVTKFQPRVYRATAILVVDSETASAPDEGTQLATTYAQLVTRPIVLQRAATLAGHVSVGELAASVQSSAESGTGLIDISVDGPNPSRAAIQANAVATAFTSVLITQGLGIKYPVVVFQQAVPPTTPDHPSPTRNAFIGGALALALALVLIHLLDSWENQTMTAAKPPERVEAAGANGEVKGGVDLAATTPVEVDEQRAESMPLGDGAE